jgi:hypothetical protein
LEVIVTVHVLAVPEHPPPDQPANVDRFAGTSVNVTCVPDAYLLCEHADPQLMFPSPLPTVPDPVPLFWTLSV